MLGCQRERGPLNIRLVPSHAAADGVSRVRVEINHPAATLSIVKGRRSAELEYASDGSAWLRIGVLPAAIVVRARMPGETDAIARITTTLDQTDRAGDGTPDFLRLNAEDGRAFRMWFTWLAEAQYERDPKTLPPEIDDCAALIRYCYREALAAHDNSWAAQLGLPEIPSLPIVRKYSYPFTPLHAAQFRIVPGPFRLADLSDGAFAQFADAKTLMRYNSHLVSRSLDEARPGDMLFFQQLGGAFAFHSMIFTGRSQFTKTQADYVVYHTGNSEIKRLATGDLLNYPEPRWRPVEGNPNFIGVFRWNIL